MTALAIHASNVLRQFDRVVLGIILLIAVLLMVSVEQAQESLGFALLNLAKIAPFLLLSVGLAAYAKATNADHLIARAFTGRTFVMVFSGALVGALSPFCSCGVIPLVAALLAMGVPLPPVMAFWLASPLMDPSMFVLTAGLLGTGFAIFKTIAALSIGLIGGYGIAFIQSHGMFAEPLRDNVGNGGCGGSRIRNPKSVVWRFWSDNTRSKTFMRTALETTLFLGKWLFLAYLLESLMLAYIPADQITGHLGGGGLLPVLLATLIGIPAYLNGYAALPLVGGLIEQGMAPAAGMAFLLAGGVTSIPAAMAVYALARPPVFLAYLGFALLGSLTMGLAFMLFS